MIFDEIEKMTDAQLLMLTNYVAVIKSGLKNKDEVLKTIRKCFYEKKHNIIEIENFRN